MRCDIAPVAKPLIVVPVRDALPHVKNCLASLPTDWSAEVLVVDDGSRRDTATYLYNWANEDFPRGEQPKRRLVVHEQPRGYAHALNTAALTALRDGFDVVVAVNSDTIFGPQAPINLASELLNRKPGTFAGPALSRAGSGQMSDPVLSEISETDDIVWSLRSAEARRTDRNLPTVQIADVNGAFFAFRVDAWLEAGPFDERYGLGAAEEIDWMRRFPEGGLYVPSICVWHAKHASYQDHPEIDAEEQWKRNNEERKRKEAAGEKWARMTYPRKMPPI